MSKRKEKPGVMLYFDMMDTVADLPDAEFSAMIRALCAFARDGTEPEWQDALLSVIWKMFRNAALRDDAHYRAIVETRSEAGKLAHMSPSEKIRYLQEHA